MSSKSPGDNDEADRSGSRPHDDSTSQRPSTNRSSIDEKVGFFETVWKNRPRSRSRGKSAKKSTESPNSTVDGGGGGGGRLSRVEAAYHGPRDVHTL